MQINPDDLRRHYASLSDDALLALNRDDLVSAAQQCYDQELVHRNLNFEEGEQQQNGGDPDIASGPEPDWLSEAACVCTFETRPGQPSASDAENAREVLEAAGISCYLATHQTDSPDLPRSYQYRIMVPGKLSLPAASVLDREIFNVEVEAEWKMYFDTLSDEELSEVDSEVLFGGLLDRIKRVKSAYEEELARRGL